MCDIQPKYILPQSSALMIGEYEIKNLGTRVQPLQNKKFRDHQRQNVTNFHKSNLQRNVPPDLSMQFPYVVYSKRNRKIKVPLNEAKIKQRI